MKLPFFAAVLAAGLHSRWLRGSTFSLPGTTTLHLESRRVLKVADVKKAVARVMETANATEAMPDAPNVTGGMLGNEMPPAHLMNASSPGATTPSPAAAQEAPAKAAPEKAAAPKAAAPKPAPSNASNMTAAAKAAPTGFANVTNGTVGNATGGNMTQDTANGIMEEEPVPMDGSAVQKPPPQFVTDFCGEQAERMTACYTWVTTMHGCYTSCKQTAQINTLEADVGGCLAAMCGYVPPLISGPADQGGICSLDGPENSESSVEHCDRQAENFLGCVTFQTKGQCAGKRTAALFEQCYDGCIAPDLMAFSPRIPPPGDPER